MAISLNLLPQERIVSKGFAKFLKLSKSFGVIAIIAFLIFSFGASILIYLNWSSTRALNNEIDKLKRDISSQEVSEQQIVLLKDRLKKVQTVKLLPNSLKNLAGVQSLIEVLPEDAQVTDLAIDSKKVELSVNFKSNTGMSGFLETLGASNTFKSITLSSFSLSPTAGYLMTMNIGGI